MACTKAVLTWPLTLSRPTSRTVDKDTDSAIKNKVKRLFQALFMAKPAKVANLLIGASLCLVKSVSSRSELALGSGQR